MATIDLTPGNDGARAKHGIRSFVHKNGPYENHYLIMDELKMAERFLVDSVTAANDDVYELISVKKGDVILGGFSYVILAGATAASVPTWGSPGDPNGLADLDPDDTVGVIDVCVPGSYPEVIAADDTLDLTVVTQILIRSVALSTGRWGLAAMIYRGSDALNSSWSSLYDNDPNLPPQV